MEPQIFKLSLKPDDHPPRVPVVYANQYDVGRPFIAEIYDVDGSPYTFTNDTVTLQGTKPSGTGFSYTVTPNGSTVPFDATGQMTVVHGFVRCGLIITKGDVVVGTLVFLLYVQQAALTAETITDSDDFNSIIDDAVGAYLESDGAAALNAAVDEWLDEHPDATTRDAYRAASIPMGQLDSTSTATVMTATVDGITELRDGVCVWLQNGVVTSASGFTININNLGAKPVYSSLAAATRVTTTFNVNYTMLLVYNSTRVSGGCWDMVYGYDTNTTYTPPKLGFGYGVCSTAAATAAKVVSISSYTLVAGGIVAVKFDNDVPAGATLNITSKGAKAIYYKNAAITDGVIKAGDTVTMMYSTNYHVLSIDRWGTDIASMQTTLNNLVVADNVGY